jgi:hypothetical protein
MAGYTDFTVGLVNTHYVGIELDRRARARPDSHSLTYSLALRASFVRQVMLPTTTIIQSARQVDPRGRGWNRLKTSLNQPDLV